MALSPATTMKKHNLQLWTSTIAAVLILLLQFMGTSYGLALNAQHALVPLKKSSSQHRVSITVQPKVSGPKGPAFDIGAKYRPPIINFNYQGGLVSVSESLPSDDLVFHSMFRLINALRWIYLLIPFVSELEKVVYISDVQSTSVLGWTSVKFVLILSRSILYGWWL